MATYFDRKSFWKKMYERKMTRAEFRQWLVARDFQLLRGTETIRDNSDNINPLSERWDGISDFHFYEDFNGPAGSITAEYSGTNVIVSAWLLKDDGKYGPIHP